MKLFFTSLYLLSVISPISGADNHALRIHRYLVVEPGVADAQFFPLAHIVTVEFPHDINTIDQAIGQLLTGTGYTVANAGVADPKVRELLQAPLPDIQRNLGPLTVVDALRALAGPGFELIIDPIHRKISFDIEPSFGGALSYAQ